jgi:lipopolysaccharide transport system ATP-binding protein
MYSEIALDIKNISKIYQVYGQPHDRLKQFVIPKLHCLLGLTPKQYYQEFRALSNITFQIKKGETVGIIGRNGSGKSTLLQLICGTVNLSEGEVKTYGRIAALLELGSGFNPEFTGRENVYMNASILGLNRKEVEDCFDSIIKFADIGDFIDLPVKTYSSGMVVRLAFAVAINASPEILIVDEALAVGDEAFQRKCFVRIEEIRNKGATILFVSHSAQSIIQLCDRAILLDQGELIGSGAPKILMAQYQRLLNSPKESASEVREIIKNQVADLQDESNYSKFYNSESPKSDTLQELVEDEHAFFDPKLLSSPGISYEDQGAGIQEIQIKTFGGRNINILQSRRKYLISYSVKFHRIAREVAFGFNLSTIMGYEIGGAGTSLDKKSQLEIVEAGQIVSVTFDFECILNPGTYFLTIGVSGIIENERIYLHRLVEALQFKVVSKDQKISNGPLNLNPIPIIQIA